MSITRVTGEVSHYGRRHHRKNGKRGTSSKSYTSSKSCG
jgi:hypothetical protein